MEDSDFTYPFIISFLNTQYMSPIYKGYVQSFLEIANGSSKIKKE